MLRARKKMPKVRVVLTAEQEKAAGAAFERNMGIAVVVLMVIFGGLGLPTIFSEHGKEKAGEHVSPRTTVSAPTEPVALPIEEQVAEAIRKEKPQPPFTIHVATDGHIEINPTTQVGFRP